MTPRRTRAERGIYYRDVRRDGKAVRVYEITYTDRFGQQRWETIHAGGIVAARAARGVRLSTGGPAPELARDTFASVSVSYMAAKRKLRPKTRETYEWALKHVLEWRPTKTGQRFGDRPIAAITADVIADLFADKRQEGLAEWSLRAIATPLHGVFAHAARRGIISDDPWALLTADEKPSSESASAMHILDRDELADVLEHADKRYRTLLLLTLFTGVRLGELLALRWADVDSKAGVLHVTEQLTARGKRAKLKTKRGERDIILAAFVVQALREHRMAAPNSTGHHPVFASRDGRPLQRKVVRSSLARAVRDANKARADADKPVIRHVRFHDLRHTYASILIAQGEDVLFISRQLGHEKASTTLDDYGELFDQARHADQARKRLDDDFGADLGS